MDDVYNEKKCKLLRTGKSSKPVVSSFVCFSLGANREKRNFKSDAMGKTILTDVYVEFGFQVMSLLMLMQAEPLADALPDKLGENDNLSDSTLKTLAFIVLVGSVVPPVMISWLQIVVDSKYSDRDVCKTTYLLNAIVKKYGGFD